MPCSSASIANFEHLIVSWGMGFLLTVDLKYAEYL